MPGICGSSLVSPCPEGTGEAPEPRWGHKKSWKGAGREVRSLWSRGGVRGEWARTEPGWGKGFGACEWNILHQEHRGLPEVLIPDDYLDLRGVVRRRAKGEGVEVAVEYGSLAAWSPEDGDELKI